jgi:hypothetical protein
MQLSKDLDDNTRQYEIVKQALDATNISHKQQMVSMKKSKDQLCNQLLKLLSLRGADPRLQMEVKMLISKDSVDGLTEVQSPPSTATTTQTTFSPASFQAQNSTPFSGSTGSSAESQLLRSASTDTNTVPSTGRTSSLFSLGSTGSTGGEPKSSLDMENVTPIVGNMNPSGSVDSLSKSIDIDEVIGGPSNGNDDNASPPEPEITIPKEVGIAATVAVASEADKLGSSPTEITTNDEAFASLQTQTELPSKLSLSPPQQQSQTESTSSPKAASPTSSSNNTGNDMIIEDTFNVAQDVSFMDLSSDDEEDEGIPAVHHRKSAAGTSNGNSAVGTSKPSSTTGKGIASSQSSASKQLTQSRPTTAGSTTGSVTRPSTTSSSQPAPGKVVPNTKTVKLTTSSSTSKTGTTRKTTGKTNRDRVDVLDRDESESVISSVSTHRSKRSTMSTVQVLTSWIWGTTEEVADDGSDGMLIVCPDDFY